MNFASVGGKALNAGMWNFGWIPPSERTQKQEEAHTNIVSSLPKFAIAGPTDEKADKVDLTELWSHPVVTKKLGYEFPGIHQYTGSCVGAGGGNMAFTSIATEVIRMGDLAEIVIPFWLLPYGRSRFYMGDRGPGVGSMGSTYAKAATEDGYVDAKDPGLPAFKNDDGLSWYSQAEMSWSDGDAPQTMNLLPQSRLRLFKTFAELKSPDDVEQAIRNLFSVTTASSLIPNATVEADGEAYGRVSRQGGHQTTLLGVWKHPSKGRLFKYVNQWGLAWGKKGMCWIPEADVMSMIRDGGETYAFSKFTDFPAQQYDLTP